MEARSVQVSAFRPPSESPDSKCSKLCLQLENFKAVRPSHKQKPLGQMAVGQSRVGYHCGVGAPPMLVYLSGDWDVHLGVRAVDPWPITGCLILSSPIEGSRLMQYPLQQSFEPAFPAT